MEKNTTELKQHHTANACTRSVSKSQILAISLLLLTVALGATLIQPIIQQNLPILYVLTSFDYFFLLLSLFDYLVLLLKNPADPRLLDPSFKLKNQKLQLCNECKTDVDIVSYHCHICNRCIQQLDNHYTFINNCVGKQNYRYFFKFLLELEVYTALNLGIGCWITFHTSGVYLWISVIYSLLSLLVFAKISCMAAYQVYINVYQSKTALKIVRKQSTLGSAAIHPLDGSLNYHLKVAAPESSNLQLLSNQATNRFPITQHPLKNQSI